MAKELGARPQPNSGATPWAKEDMKDSHFLIQHKEVQDGTKSHTIKIAELEDLRRNAIDDERRPMYVIDAPLRRWVMVEYDVWKTAWEASGYGSY